jgi:hypothetical protein
MPTILAGISDLAGQAVTRENSTLAASAPPRAVAAPKVTLSPEGGSFATANERASLSSTQADFNYVFNV